MRKNLCRPMTGGGRILKSVNEMKIDHTPWTPEPSRADRDIAWKSKRNGNGSTIVDGRVVMAGSFNELSGILLLRSRIGVAEIVEQVKFDWIDDGGKDRLTYIDAVVTMEDGSRIGYTMKPFANVKGEFLREIPLIAYHARATGFLDDFRLLTDRDMDPVEVYNATMMHGMRRPDVEADAAAARVVNAMAYKATVGELRDEIGLGNRGFRAIVRLLKSHHLRLVKPERIDLPTLVYKSARVEPDEPACRDAA